MTDDATTIPEGLSASATPFPPAPAAAAAAPVLTLADEPVADAPTQRRCPWCSELLPDDATDRCPACKANLTTELDTRMPGLTEVEAPTATRVRLAEAPRRSKLLSWISGDLDDVSTSPPGNVDPDAVALPPRDVRREMLRLKLEAEGLTVTADGSIELPPDATAATPPAPAITPEADAEAPAEEIRKAS